jgi:catechol 2,3-dioxygenase-like lactoylglutathione lyase family enzyme
LHQHFNDLESTSDVHLYGQRMYEIMAACWPTADENPSAPKHEIEYARIGRAYPSVREMTDVMPILNQINIVAKDFDATIEFYCRLGVNVTEATGSADGNRHAKATLPDGFVLEFDNHALARVYNAAWRRSEGSSKVLIGFSLPTRYAELVAVGYKGRQSPYDAFWGARYAVVADPDGNDVALMSPLDENRRTWPPTESPSA